MHSLVLFSFLALSSLSITTLAIPTSEPRSLEKRGLWCSADTSDAYVTDWAATDAWKISMLSCLQFMATSGWRGTRCFPTYAQTSRDPNPHPTFSFWKAHAIQFRDPKDCYEKCQDCLRRGIMAGKAVTTQCNYQARRATLGSTCEMGFEYDTEESIKEQYYAYPPSGPFWNETTGTWDGDVTLTNSPI
ncbi:MAG: hypothetical protein Q9166_005034 [cf. Caloplaca sp. 2 TL-2023]